MKKFLLCALSLVTLSLQAINYCAPQSWGYAGSSVTGGGSATPTLVSSVSELKSAIGSKAKDKVVIITKSLTFTSMLTMQNAQNVTILGLPGVKLVSTQQNATTSGILFVKKSSNIIIRNLIFEGPGAYDCDGNDNLCFEGVTKAWVDHCEFQDGCDGNFDNKSTTDNVTVSWCRFRYLKAPKAGGSGGADDHRFTNLLGSSSSDKPSDGTYNFTWAYCWWDEGCKERMVRCRNAELHFLNCYWNSSVANYYVGPENVKAYFEGCTFEGKANTSKNIFKSYGGTNACKFVNCSGKLPSNSGTVNAPTYAYDQLNPADSKTYVTNETCGAGATLIINTQAQIGSSCDGGDTPTPDPQDTTDVDPPTPQPTQTYTLSYDENGGSGAMEPQTAEDGQSLTVKANAFTAPAGYSFKEWNDNYKGSGTKYNAGQSVTMHADLTLYAVWSPNSYTITLNANGGTGGTTSVQAVFDEPMPNITIPSREGYTFVGYFDAQNKQYYDKNGSSMNSWVTPSNATLTAQWQENGSVPPEITGDLHFWFIHAADAATNNVTNDASVFSNMVSSSSSKDGSITIDGTSYSVTRRSGDPSDRKFGSFTVPAGKQAIFYSLAISSGGADRQIDLISATDTFELSVPGGSSTYQRLESDPLPAGTYSIERAASSGNVRIAVIVLKFIDDDEPSGIENPAASKNAARKVLRSGQVVIYRDGKTYSILGQSL